MLAIGARGATQVRGKDSVHPENVRKQFRVMNSFLARQADSGQQRLVPEARSRKGAHMSQKPPTRAMRENPDLEQLKRQAKELLEAYRASSPEAVAEVNAYHRTATPESLHCTTPSSCWRGPMASRAGRN